MFDVTPENSVSGDGAVTANEREIQVLMHVAYREADVPEQSENEKECAYVPRNLPFATPPWFLSPSSTTRILDLHLV